MEENRLEKGGQPKLVQYETLVFVLLYENLMLQCALMNTAKSVKQQGPRHTSYNSLKCLILNTYRKKYIQNIVLDK